MDTLPPRWLRRLIVTPVVFVGALVLALLSPILHLVAAVLDLMFDRRRRRISRFVGIGLAFCVVEVFGLFALLTVWVGSGFGIFMDRPFWVRANTKLTGQYFELITRAIRFYLGFGFSYTYEPVPAGPQLLIARHAGPGDAFLIARVVIRDLGRRVHMIGATKLQWDPFLDITGERLGYHYLSGKRGDSAADFDGIRRVASGLDADETLVIFPEGGNFTAKRRDRSIEMLRARGRLEHARYADELRHTLLPRAGAFLAASEGAPEATVVFVAHAGLENLHGLSDLWASVPLDRDVAAHAWPAITDDRPTGPDGRTTWLFEHWRAVDLWIERHLNESAAR